MERNIQGGLGIIALVIAPIVVLRGIAAIAELVLHGSFAGVVALGQSTEFWALCNIINVVAMLTILQDHYLGGD